FIEMSELSLDDKISFTIELEPDCLRVNMEAHEHDFQHSRGYDFASYGYSSSEEFERDIRQILEEQKLKYITPKEYNRRFNRDFEFY
ncbi:MAG: hypothetical protein AABW45_02600, partial [Nanoarchaeota archaeon]